jgi:hypothetical protein
MHTRELPSSEARERQFEGSSGRYKMISVSIIIGIARKYMEESNMDKDKAIKLCDRIPDTSFRNQVINRIKGMK